MTVRGFVGRSLAVVVVLYLAFVAYMGLTPGHTANSNLDTVGPPQWCATVTSPTPECY